MPTRTSSSVTGRQIAVWRTGRHPDRKLTGLAPVAAEALGPLAVAAENLIGPPATEVLQKIWSRVVGAVSEKDEVSALFACLQLAKAARFVGALQAGVGFDARTDDASQRLLEEIGRIEEEPERDSAFDAVTLVTPYTERLDTGDTSPAQQRQNLERAFGASVQRSLTGEQGSWLLDINTVLGLLPADTVLLYTYLSHSPGGGRSMLSLRDARAACCGAPSRARRRTCRPGH